MKPEGRQFVASIQAMMADILARKHERLAGVGLLSRACDPRIIGDDCELCVEFVGIEGMDDLLEFHVILDSKQVAGPKAIRSWFEMSLADVIERAEGRLAATRLRH